MSRSLKICVTTLALIAATASAAWAQAVPTASTMSPSVGRGLPSIDGVFHYALRASEMVEFGNANAGSGTGNSAVFSGDAAYNSTSVVHPFSMIYAGGVLLGNQYGGHATAFQNLAISQGLVVGRWNFGVSDSVSYLPETPTLGLSGIPGVGDLGSGQGPSTGPAGGVLTNNATNVSNALSGNVERELTPLTSISGSGSWSILRFPKGDGLENTRYSGDIGLNHRLDARDTISGTGIYSTYSYGGGIDLTIQTRGFDAAFERVLSRSLRMNASAGPVWISGSNSALLPSRLTYDANLSLVYSREITNMSLNYTHGVNGGSGVQPGALTDSLFASIGRTYDRDWLVSFNGDYTRSSGLVQNGALVGSPTSPFLYASGTTNLAYGGAQVSRKLTDSFSAFATYTIQHQSIDDSLSSQNAFSGLTQTVGVGITFSPRSTSLGQF